MATLAVESTSRAAGGSVLDVTLNTAAGGGDVFPNDGKTVLVIENGSGGDITVTVGGGTNPANGKAYAAEDHIVVAGDSCIAGPFNPGDYNNSSGQVALTYSGVTSLTVGVVSLTGAGKAL